MTVDWFALACRILAPSVSTKTAAQIDAEEEEAIERFEQEHPAPKHDLSKHEN